MKRILAALGVTSLALLGASGTAFATGETTDGGEKITICHATGSESNPYVKMTIDLNGLNGHAGHQHQEDIIPANNGKVLPGGQNLDKVDWWNAGCAKPGGEVTPTPKPTHTRPHEDHDKKITICHATGSASNPYVVVTINLNGLNGHAGHQHSEDIIPPNHGKVLPAGQNWTDEGRAVYNNNCVPVKVPPTDKPVVPPTDKPVVPPTDNPVVPPAGAVVPPAGAVVPPAGAVVPPAAAVVPPAKAGAGAVAAPNQGFNVQTAVADSSGTAAAPWIGGLAALMLAGAALAVRKTHAKTGSHHGQHRA